MVWEIADVTKKKAWLRNGWLFGPSRVKDWDLWEQLVKLLDDLRDRWQVDVRFWWVPPHWNLTTRREARLGTRVPPPVAAPIARSAAAYCAPDHFQVRMGD